MKKNKILYLLAVIIIVIGILVAIFEKFNFVFEYQQTKKVSLYLEIQANLEDIEQIAKEVFEEQELLVREVGTFNDMFEIRIKDVTEEQKNNLLTKLSEKYDKEMKEETNLTISEVPSKRGRDLIKPYIWPVSISGVLILAYLGIWYRKLNASKVILSAAAHVILIEAVYASLIAITRIPVSPYTIPVGIAVAIFTLMYLTYKWEKKQDEIKEEVKK